jgi:predicted DNA-binding transcriptional regulator AlpA
MKVLRLPEVIEATALSRPTIYRMEVRGEFRSEDDWESIRWDGSRRT